MKIPSVNISPRVQCGKSAGKTRVSLTQLNSNLHCREFVRMVEGRKEGRNHELGLEASVLAHTQPRLCPGGKQNLSPRLCVFDFHSYEL